MGGHLRLGSQRGPQRVPLTPNAECDPGWSPREEADVTTDKGKAWGLFSAGLSAFLTESTAGVRPGRVGISRDPG